MLTVLLFRCFFHFLFFFSVFIESKFVASFFLRKIKWEIIRV